MNAIQEFLRNGGTLNELIEKFALKIRRHEEHPTLVLFKYDQVNSKPDDHPLVVAARGLILDEADNWKVINWPFERFFNYGQACADTIDLNEADIFTKMDGSLICLWNYKGVWQVSTSGSIAAEGNVNGFNFSFAELFEKAAGNSKIDLPHRDEAHLCFMFEMTSVYNKIVVQYGEPSLTLIGVRNRDTGEELLPETFQRYPQVKQHKFNDTAAMIDWLKDVPAIEMEGFVVRGRNRKANGSFTRLKIKSDQYIRFHHIKSGWSIRNAVEIILHGEQEEVTLGCPEYTEVLNDIESKFNGLIHQLETIYVDLKHLTDKKEFALALQAINPPAMGALYMYHAGKIGSVREYLCSLHIDSLIDALKLKE